MEGSAAARSGPFRRASLSAALLLAMLLLPALPGRAYPVEAGHPVYGLIRRLSLRGDIPRPFLGSLPFQDAEVLSILRAAEAGRSRLPARDRRELDRLLREFDPTLRRERSRLAWGDSTRRLEGSAEAFLGGYWRDSLPRTDAFAVTAVQAGLDGALGPVDFTTRASVAGEASYHPRYLLNYDPQRGLPYNTRKGRTDPADLDARSTFDAFRTVAGYRGAHWSVEAGNDWNQWGPGTWQHPAFGPRPWAWVQDSLPGSDTTGFSGSYVPGSHRRGFRYPGEGPALNQIRLVFDWPFLRYTRLVAQKTGLIKSGRAFLVAHRLEARAGRLLVGAYEMVALAGRSFEGIYAVPFVPLKIAEHLVGDKDNIALGIDADWAVMPGLRLYAELFLDDLLGPQDLFGSYWGNKYAFLAGFETADLLVPASGFALEYARVEPWLFGHHVYNNQLQHFGSLLGSSLPPNSHALRARFLKGLPGGFEAGLEYGFLQRQLRDPGSSIFDVHVDSLHGTRKDFLGGSPETRHALRATGTWSPAGWVEARLAAGFLGVTDWKGREGTALTTPTLEAEAVFRY